MWFAKVLAKLREARSGPDRPGWTHARSYVGKSPTNMVHRARLSKLRSLLSQTALPQRGLLIDLGCSDGFILSELRRNGDVPAIWRFAGYDVNRALLRAARRRDVPRTTFRRIDLNDDAAGLAQPGDVVICLETLEHVGSYRNALDVLHAAARPGGLIVLSMPNEVGPIGFVKFMARPILRRNAYTDFFRSKRQIVHYAIAVLARGELESFRTPPRPGWAAHLGFDHRAVTQHIRRTFVETGLWEIEMQSTSAFGANIFVVARRRGEPLPTHALVEP